MDMPLARPMTRVYCSDSLTPLAPPICAQRSTRVTVLLPLLQYSHAISTQNHESIHSFIHSSHAFPIHRSGALQQTFYGSPPPCPVLEFLHHVTESPASPNDIISKPFHGMKP